MSEIAQYVAVALIDYATKTSPKILRGDRTHVEVAIRDSFGPGGEAYLDDAIKILSRSGIALRATDQFAGEFFKIDPAQLRDFVDRCQRERVRYKEFVDQRKPSIANMLGTKVDFDDIPPNTRNASIAEANPALEYYHEFGGEWLQRALDNIRNDSRERSKSLIEVVVSSHDVEVPASDRLVSVDHNSPEATAIDAAFEALEAELTQSNEAFSVDTAEREAAVAEVSSLRRLWQASVIRVDVFKGRAEKVLLWVTEKAATVTISEMCKHLIKLIFGWS